MHPLVFKMLPKHNNPNPNRGSLTFQSYISFSSHAGVARCRFVIDVATLLLWAHTTVPTPLTIEDLCISNVFFILLSTMLTRVFLFSFFLIWVFWTTHPRVRGPFSLSFAFVFPDNNDHLKVEEVNEFGLSLLYLRFWTYGILNLCFVWIYMFHVNMLCSVIVNLWKNHNNWNISAHKRTR